MRRNAESRHFVHLIHQQLRLNQNLPGLTISWGTLPHARAPSGFGGSEAAALETIRRHQRQVLPFLFASKAAASLPHSKTARLLSFEGRFQPLLDPGFVDGQVVLTVLHLWRTRDLQGFLVLRHSFRSAAH